MEEKWDLNDKLFISFFTALSCGLLSFIASDLALIVNDLWYGFGDVVVEFGSIIEQLPI